MPSTVASADPMAVFERWYAAHESQDLQALAGVLAEDVEVRSVLQQELVFGREAAIAHFVGVASVFGDLAMELACRPAASDDRVLVEVVLRGRFTGELSWFGARHRGDGQFFEVPGVAVVRSGGGQVRSVQTFFDRDAWLLQMGIDATTRAGAPL